MTLSASLLPPVHGDGRIGDYTGDGDNDTKNAVLVDGLATHDPTNRHNADRLDMAHDGAEDGSCTRDDGEL